MTGQHSFLRRLVDRLEQAGIDYMIAGSVGSSLHGRPRATQDVDIVIVTNQTQLQFFIESLGDSYYVNEQAARDALQRCTMFNVIDVENGWKADLIIRKSRAFSHVEFDRRRRIELGEQRLWVVSPEDTILSKLEWTKGRESEVQYGDALGVAIVHYGTLDQDYLVKWANELGVSESLERLLAEAKDNTEHMS